VTTFSQLLERFSRRWFVGAVNRIACQVFGESFDQTLKEANSAPFCSFVTDTPQCEGVDESKIPRIDKRVSPLITAWEHGLDGLILLISSQLQSQYHPIATTELLARPLNDTIPTTCKVLNEAIQERGVVRVSPLFR
jgi:hypothetical protein